MSSGVMPRFWAAYHYHHRGILYALCDYHNFNCCFEKSLIRGGPLLCSFCKMDNIDFGEYQ